MDLHLDSVHGLLSVNTDAVQLCTSHNQWLFGFVQIHKHCCGHAEEVLSCLELFDFAQAGLCPWCMANDKQHWSTCSKAYDTAASGAQHKHICLHHLWYH